ncbi:MAG: glyoxalase/bleomycin resistance/dioxygenase family protein [Woeseia sp.]|nr:VOC family protein [Woeseia sp.]MBT8097470.1 VOC family protein [Woeseia sp.]NNE60900.1 glyoxalase/bleomycin resistance/dioxygenase family protein [Woeseia sp.]NNL53942.1 glyoxalase/bleomycin resistance/dioxygenase family protein [Woeseia sp.]
MKRLHIHVGVDSLDESIRFYNALFDAKPVKTKADYAKWMLDDPFVNFAISTRSGKTGIDHLGLQVGNANELKEMRDRLKNADMTVYDEGEATCCYARSDKSWVKDPAGIGWETFQSMQDLQTFSTEEPAEPDTCCIPDANAGPNAAVTAKQSTGACC